MKINKSAKLTAALCAVSLLFTMAACNNVSPDSETTPPSQSVTVPTDGATLPTENVAPTESTTPTTGTPQDPTENVQNPTVDEHSPTVNPVDPTESTQTTTLTPVTPTEGTQAPTTTPIDPTEGTQAPITTPVDPTEGTQAPITTPVDPTEGTQAPTATPVDPTEGAQKPTATPVDPTEGTQAPTVTPATPTEGTQAPTATPVTPTESTQAPTVTPVTPTEGTQAPTVTSVTPTEGTQAPTIPTQPTEAPLPPSVTIPPETNPDNGTPEPITFPCDIPDYGLVIEKLAPYSGMYVEDGTNVNVQNVAMLLLRNNSDLPIEFTQICVEFGEEKLMFDVTALPAGELLVVQEKYGKSIPEGETTFVSAAIMQRADMSMSDGKVEVIDNGNNTLTIKNLTNEDIPTVRVFYKYYMADENIFVGGIAFTLRITRLGAGTSITVQPSHYASQTCRVVMVLTYNTEV